MTNWFQTNSAYQLFSQSEDMRPVRVSTAHCSCVATVMGKEFCKRAIIQGGPAIDDSATQDELTELLQDLKRKCIDMGVVYIETRNFSDYSSYRQTFENQGFKYQPHYDVHISVTEHSLSPAKKRQIAKSIQEGLYWEETRNEEDVHNWYKLLKHLYSHKVHRPLPSEHFFQLAAQQTDCHLLVVRGRDTQILGGVLMPVFCKTSYEWYICGGSMATFAAIEWSKQNGIEIFDTMGAGVPDKPYGVRDFKLQMGGILHEYGRFLFVNKPVIYHIGKLLINSQ